MAFSLGLAGVDKAVSNSEVDRVVSVGALVEGRGQCVFSKLSPKGDLLRR